METLPALDFKEARIESRVGTRFAIVVSPMRPMLWGHARLEQLRQATGASTVDRQIFEAVKQRGARVTVLCIRGKNDDVSGHWRLEDDLDDGDAEELGYLLVRSQLATYRRLVAHGIIALIHSDWGPREATAFRRGSERLRSELRLAQASREKLALEVDPVAALDRWMLQHLTFFLTLSTTKVLDDFLPEKLPLLVPRVPRIAALLAALPHSAIA
jgi:hypothetical protein